MAGAGVAIETDPFKRQQAGPPAGMSGSTGSGGLRPQLVSAQWPRGAEAWTLESLVVVGLRPLKVGFPFGGCQLSGVLT